MTATPGDGAGTIGAAWRSPGTLWGCATEYSSRLRVRKRTLSAAAAATGVSVPCARWAGRYRTEDESGLLDRDRRVAAATGDRGGDRETLGKALSTVSVILRRSGTGRLGRMGLEQAVRSKWRRGGSAALTM